MARQSPPTARVLQTLAAFSAAPDQPLTLSMVVARTGLAPATCLGILNTLHDHGYLVRPNEHDRSFVLGPAAMTLGRAAQSAHSAATLASDAMHQLSTHWNAPCTASAIIDGYVTVLTRVGPPIAYEPGIEVGRRFALRPPIGLLNIVWYPDADIDHWLAQPQVLPVRQDRARLRDVIATARATGYLVERWKRTVDLDAIIDVINDDQLPQHVAELLAGYATTLGERDYVARELDADELEVASISAPVYDERGRPLLLLLLYLLRDQMTASEMRACGRELLATTSQLTEEVGGRDPWKGT